MIKDENLSIATFSLLREHRHCCRSIRFPKELQIFMSCIQDYETLHWCAVEPLFKGII
jgi:hypothetical protein